MREREKCERLGETMTLSQKKREKETRQFCQRRARPNNAREISERKIVKDRKHPNSFYKMYSLNSQELLTPAHNIPSRTLGLPSVPFLNAILHSSKSLRKTSPVFNSVGN